ncbi:MAG: endonuclease/exonuclease/phosphatase, partial [Chitinophagales bacterium]
MKSFLIFSRFFVFVIITTFGLTCAGQKTQYGILFYNVENLFDTIDTPGKIDGEYTPASKKKWDTEKYNTKLQNLAQVIAAPDTHLPALIGLCEVENKNVLEDLILQGPLISGGYRIIHFESPDERGIDVALLYQDKLFTVKQFRKIHVALPEDNGGATRDILYVQGRFKNVKQDLHIFVNHWPSRSEGEEITRV